MSNRSGTHAVEREFLARVLQDPRTRSEALARLDADDFDHPRYRDAFKAMEALESRGETIDTSAIIGEVAKAGQDTDSWASFLSETVSWDGSRPPTRVAQDVKDNARRRRVAAVMEEGARLARDPSHSVDSVVGNAVDTLTTAGSSDSGVVTVDGFRDRLMDLYEDGLKPGPSTGWPNVDKHYRPAPGQWTVITGIPGMGKSTFLDALLLNLAVKHDHRYIIFSPENFPAERHAAKLISSYTSRPFSRNTIPENLLRGALEFIEKHFVWIDPNDATSVRGILTRAQTIHRQWPVNGLVIDPWNEVEHVRGDTKETDYISSSLTAIRRFSRRLNLHTWVVAHPTKLEKGRDGFYPVPTPYDISGSANWRNKADFAVTVHRDVLDAENTVGLHVQKVRFGEHGKVGRVDLVFDPSCGQYRPRNGDPYREEGR